MDSTVRVCDCHWVRVMHSEVCRDMRGDERMSGTWRVTLFSSAVPAISLTCSCKTSTSATGLIWMKAPLEFHVTLPLRPLVRIWSTKPTLTKALGCIFCKWSWRCGVWKCLCYHGLTVPCASVREHKSDKIPVVAHGPQFKSPVSSSSS